ncbi:hypothetical protein BC826DRAFT_104230 [Russula brevipes]|nr:hypothetical protein BC826DRAFT_104230 [Russula brevipes]
METRRPSASLSMSFPPFCVQAPAGASQLSCIPLPLLFRGTCHHILSPTFSFPLLSPPFIHIPPRTWVAFRSRFWALSARDAILILLGAASMHVYSSFSAPVHDTSIIFDAHLSSQDTLPHVPQPVPVVSDSWRPPAPPKPAPATPSPSPNLEHELPHTELVSHAPGWTVFRNLYMADGTLFIVTSNPDSFPDIKLITSTGLPAENTPESIAERMPTSRDMSIISPEEARQLWGQDQSPTASTTYFLLRDHCTPTTRLPDRRSPLTFISSFSTIPDNVSCRHFPFLVSRSLETVLAHYYHFCAELVFGAWAFWHGTFRGASSNAPIPSLTRVIFPHATAEEWRDGPGMNFFFLRSAWPSLTVETRPDWVDRVSTTAPRSGERHGRAWWFDTVLLADRSAAFRGPECGERTQRTAAEAVKGVVERAGRTGFLDRGWWEPVRRNVLRFAGVAQRTLEVGQRAFKRASRGSPRTGGVEDVVVTYISRQAVKRHLIPDDHEGLVRALTELCERRGWELNVVAMERLSKEEQLAVAARTTFLVGVHGNGLTHLIMMPITPISSVIEIFYPEGYAHDYEWTTRALGMRHFGVWNDTSRSEPDVTWPNYPEGFQGSQIPVHGPYVAKLIEDRADGFLP